MSFPIIQSSARAKRTTNPIRKIVDNLRPDPNHPLPLLNLALGDPTIHGSHLQCPSVLQNAVQEVLRSNVANGYLPSFGSNEARASIATYSSRPGAEVTAEDIIVTSGCSGAVEIALAVLLNEGDNLLVPQPGFPLYQVVTESLGASVKFYPLKPEASWECDLVAMEALIDERTRGILINNPSNPCGSNYSAQHLSDIAALASRYGLPIVADEIYSGLVFNGTFTPLQSVRGDVPVLSLGGLAKEFVVPGWRVGWVVVHDTGSHGRFAEVRAGLRSLSQLILGASSLIQQAIPAVLTPAPGSDDSVTLLAFNTLYMDILRQNAALCATLSSECTHISVLVPDGAMYAMVRINFETLDGSIVDDKDFCELLLVEENLSVLPGQCFGMKNYFRLVTCPPAATLHQAFERIKAFCGRRSSLPVPPPSLPSTSDASDVAANYDGAACDKADVVTTFVAAEAAVVAAAGDAVDASSE